MEMVDLFRLMLKKSASDLFITVGAAPSLKVDGQILPIKTDVLDSQSARDLAYSIMNDDQRKKYEVEKESNFAVNPEGMGRFRVNVFQQQGEAGMVIRRITSKIPTFDDINIPAPVFEKIAMMKRGLIFFVGGTGTGKSTTMAAVLGYRNRHTRGHIVTVEDPIEYVHSHERCIVTQREVGVDTMSFQAALENAMRQAPDVIQIGEVRTPETMKAAIVFAETGHLCIATLHANNTYQALDRVINLYPDDNRDHLFMDLSMNLRAIISQRLIPNARGEGSVPAIEIMLNSPLISDLIAKGEIREIREIMERSTEEGMMTFDQCLFNLYEKGLITYEDAMKNADSVNNLRLKIKLEGEQSKGSKDLGSTFEKVEF